MDGNQRGLRGAAQHRWNVGKKGAEPDERVSLRSSHR